MKRSNTPNQFKLNNMRIYSHAFALNCYHHPRATRHDCVESQRFESHLFEPQSRQAPRRYLCSYRF